MKRLLFLSFIVLNMNVFASNFYKMPEENEKHKGTFMSIQTDENIWGKKLAKPVKDTLINLANIISKYEPVYAFVDPDDDIVFDNDNVIKIPFKANDIWMRDTSSVFVKKDGKLYAINFNFNGWGEKQEYERDALLASKTAEIMNAIPIKSNIVLEGGSIEIDGDGTAIITESAVLNDNRNPDLTKEEIEEELKSLLGLEKIIWLPGIKGMDITDGHTDFYARFAKPGIVVVAREDDPNIFDYDVTREHLEILKNSTDAKGRKLEIHILPAPTELRKKYLNKDFAAGYINFYVLNGAVIAPQFGDEKADKKAYDTLKKLFPDRDIIQVNIDPISAGGGGIHCSTYQMPE